MQASRVARRYYTLNDRPVLLDETIAWVQDLRSGRLLRDPGGFEMTSDLSRDVQVHTAEEFWWLVAEHLCRAEVQWEPFGNGEHPCQYDGWVIRVGDFPAEALYHLTRDGEDVMGLDDWPTRWRRPCTAPPAPA